jgi:hypothetical protein
MNLVLRPACVVLAGLLQSAMEVRAAQEAAATAAAAAAAAEAAAAGLSTGGWASFAISNENCGVLVEAILSGGGAASISGTASRLTPHATTNNTAAAGAAAGGVTAAGVSATATPPATNPATEHSHFEDLVTAGATPATSTAAGVASSGAASGVAVTVAVEDGQIRTRPATPPTPPCRTAPAAPRPHALARTLTGVGEAAVRPDSARASVVAAGMWATRCWTVAEAP